MQATANNTTTRRLLLPREAAAMLGVCTKTLDNLWKDKKIARVKVGNQNRYKPEELERYIQSNTEQA